MEKEAVNCDLNNQKDVGEYLTEEMAKIFHLLSQPYENISEALYNNDHFRDEDGFCKTKCVLNGVDMFSYNHLNGQMLLDVHKYMNAIINIIRPGTICDNNNDNPVMSKSLLEIAAEERRKQTPNVICWL